MVRDGTRSLEVRWIFPGQMGTGVAQWLDRFPVETESREDIYLVNPGLRGLSVKIRAGRALEVKEFGGSRGTLFARGGVCGGMQSWHKWSFPFTPPSRGIGDPPGWRPVDKRRRISQFSLADGRIASSAQAPAGEAVCTVELTAVRTGGQSWWSLGFEATGRDDLLPGALEATATVVFAQPLPGGLQPGLDESTSYAEWLLRPPSHGRGYGEVSSEVSGRRRAAGLIRDPEGYPRGQELAKHLGGIEVRSDKKIL